MEVAWRKIVDWPYSVSSDGQVRNDRSGRTIRQNLHKSGYLQVQVWNKRKFKTFLVHRLVAQCFLGDKPELEVAHSDGIRTNNNLANLRWVSHVENMRDRDLHGSTARGVRNGKTKHSDDLVSRCIILQAQGLTLKAIAQELNIPLGTVSGYVYRSRRKVR